MKHDCQQNFDCNYEPWCVLCFRKQTKKVRDLWWMGLPTNVRGKVWQMAIGNELNITHGNLSVV